MVKKKMTFENRLSASFSYQESTPNVRVVVDDILVSIDQRAHPFATVQTISGITVTNGRKKDRKSISKAHCLTGV